MLRLAVCDDEDIHRKILKDKIIAYSLQYGIDFSLQEFTTANELLVAPCNYDMLFLDIKLENGINGIDIGCQLRDQGNDCIIILVTSLEQYAKQGYYADVFRYIVKPILQNELNEALNAGIQKIRRSKAKIQVKCLEAIQYFNVDDIILIESYNRKRSIYYKDQCYETWENLNVLFQKLPFNQFAYPNQSYIVNFDYIQCEKNNIITMENGKEIVISRNYLQSFMTELHRYVSVK